MGACQTAIHVPPENRLARRLADRIAFLLAGEIVEVSPVEPFFEAPTDPRTRAFVNGEMIY